jgi:hypothetical protein
MGTYLGIQHSITILFLFPPLSLMLRPYFLVIPHHTIPDISYSYRLRLYSTFRTRHVRCAINTTTISPPPLEALQLNRNTIHCRHLQHTLLRDARRSVCPHLVDLPIPTFLYQYTPIQVTSPPIRLSNVSLCRLAFICCTQIQATMIWVPCSSLPAPFP